MTNIQNCGTPGPQTMLDWVTKYGIATVFATILLGWFLWTNYTQWNQEMVLIQQTAGIVQDQTKTLADISRALNAVSQQQSDTAKTLERISMRLDNAGGR